MQNLLETLALVRDAVPRPVAVLLVPILLVAFVLTATKLWTTFLYYRAIHRYQLSNSSGIRIVEPPQIPYYIPWLGNALAFLNARPGRFWTELFKWHPRYTGALTLLVAGRRTHIVYSPFAIQALFKDRSANRDVMEHDLYEKVFEMSEDQIALAHGGKALEASLNAQFMTNFDRVNELTAHFTKVLDDVLRQDAEAMENRDAVGIYDWLRDHMFTASMTALMGEKILEMYPTLSKDFFKFDGEFLEFFFSKPAFLMTEANARRTRMFRNFELWADEMHRLSGGAPVNPEKGPSWEPFFGSRLNRARQIAYRENGLHSRSAAALDVGITFALAGNAIPATGWMLFYILRPETPTLYPRVLAEILEAEREDGSIDVPKLVSQPLLQSIWIECLRLCSDILVTRTLMEDTCLPLDADGKVQVLMRKGDNCFAPCWITHRDPSWTDLGDGRGGSGEFNPERFLVTNAKTAQKSFSMSGTAGMFFPFGGGKTICPGRIFAKQEALGGLAMTLLRFEFDVLGYVDAKGQSTLSFPGFKSAFPGTGALVPGGDMMAKIRPRRR